MEKKTIAKEESEIAKAMAARLREGEKAAKDMAAKEEATRKQVARLVQEEAGEETNAFETEVAIRKAVRVSTKSIASTLAYQ